MCGQFGIVTNTSHVHTADDFLADAFTASMLRGVDSSGIANIDIKKNQYDLHKLPVNGLFFTGDTIAKRLMKYGTSPQQISMCHVRAATTGSVSVSNAHPFAAEREEEVLVGTHNGTLTGWANKPGARAYDVDSEWALNHITDKGLEAFKDFNGAFSFVWWRGSDKETLHMARNKERTMCVAFLRNGGMAYASEAGMLYWLLERNNLFMDGPILFLDEDKYYKFSVKSPKEFTTEELPKPAVTVFTSATYGRYGTNTSTTYKTTVDKVKDLLAKASKEEETPVPLADEEGEERVFPQAYESEIKLAREYGWFDIEGEFTPMQVDGAGNTRGIVEVCGTEFDAVVRGDWRGIYGMDDVWKCIVLGAQDEHDVITLILSKPTKTIPWYTIEEEV